MAILKCKMCGGDLIITEGLSTCECEYCGSLQTVPKVDDERKLAAYARANTARAACEFDKASGIYENIIAESPNEAEAYWGLVLCQYGIEYVDDPKTNKKIPTCHRSSFDSIFDDSNYLAALEKADVVAGDIYKKEAAQIENIRKSIIEFSSTEEPYDIFICYKETDEYGNRTTDSLIAQNVYDALSEKGYRVFFSRVTLESALGETYEPIIFAALNSAKIMLAFGTSYEHYQAVWVKNEWSRFLKLIAKGEKKTLIPCYKDIDPNNMPKEFKSLQAQDMGKVGAIQDLLRGVEKILPKSHTSPVSNVQSSAIETLLKRVSIYLDDGNWSDADEYCEKMLDIDPENAEAYLGKLLAELKIRNQNELKLYEYSINGFPNFQKALRFGNEKLVSELKNISSVIEENCNQKIYDNAVREMSAALNKQQWNNLAGKFRQISGFKDADMLAEKCEHNAIIAGKESIYLTALDFLAKNTVESLTEAKKLFTEIEDYKDSAQKITECQNAINKIYADNEKYWISRFDEVYKLLKKKEFADAGKLVNEIESVAPTDARVYICKLLINYKVKNENQLAKQALQEKKSLKENIYFRKIVEYGDRETAERFNKIAESMKKARVINRLLGWLLAIVYISTSIIPAFIIDQKNLHLGFWKSALFLALPIIIYELVIGILGRVTGDRYELPDSIISAFFISIITDLALLLITGCNSVFFSLITNKVSQGIIGFIALIIFVKFENYNDEHNKNNFKK